MIYYVIAVKDESIYRKEFHDTYTSNTKIMSGTDNIFRKYNNAVRDIGALNENDVVIFLHDDITILEKDFNEKIEMYFKYKKNVGIAGVIGTTIFPEAGGWWMVDRQIHTRGKIMQGHPHKEPYLMNDKTGMYDDLVSIDGCIMMIRGSVFHKFRFDEETYDGFHFYDVDTCLEIMKMGLDVGTIDVLVQHESEGPMPATWQTNKDKFIQKWTKQGFTFPLNKTQFENYK